MRRFLTALGTNGASDADATQQVAKVRIVPSMVVAGLKLGTNEGVAQVAAFIRSVVIARLITPHDFGIAATLALLFALLQMVTNLSMDKLLVQADNGDAADFQRSIHAVQAVRGIALSAVLFAVAGPTAALFGVPEARWAFQCVAGVPLIAGLTHTDIFRLQRERHFGPLISVNIWTAGIVTAASVPLALWLRSYSAMVWVLILQAGCAAAMSHLVARRPYRWAWTPGHVRQMLAFGWPLLVNGLLLFLILQGDRLVIGSSERLFANAGYSLSDLAVYSLAMSVAQMPGLLIANVCTYLFLPVLSRSRTVKALFARDYLVCTLIVCLGAAATSGPLILFGSSMVGLIYGTVYASGWAVMMWLSAAQAVRVIRTAPTLGAIAVGDTRSPMMSNIIRTPTFVIMLLVAAGGWPLAWMAACGFAGEVVALAYALWRLWRRHGVAPRLSVAPYAMVYGLLVMAAVGRCVGLSEPDPATITASAVLGVSALVAIVVAHPRVRRDLRSLGVWRN